MMAILSPNQVCSAVISLKTLPLKETQNHNQNSPRLRKVPPIRFFSESVPSSVVKSLLAELEKPRPFEEVLVQFKFSFLHPPAGGRTLHLRPSLRDIATTLNSYLDLCAKNQYCDSPRVSTLLHAFAALLNSPQKPTCHDQIFVSTFFHLFMKVCTTIADSELESVAHSVFRICSSPNPIPESCYDMIVALIRRLVHLNSKVLSPLATEVVACLDKLVAKKRRRVPTKALISIVELLCGPMSGFDMTVLRFYSNLAAVVPVGELLPFLPLIELTLFSLVESEDAFIPKPIVADAICLAECHPDDLPLLIINPGPFDLTNDLKLPQLLPANELVPDSLYPYIVMVANVVCANLAFAEALVGVCMKFSASMPPDHVYDIIAVSLILNRQIAAYFDCLIPFELLSNYRVFDPSITMFHPCQHWREINTLRSFAMEMLLQEGSSQLPRMLQSVIQYPLMFAEILFRFENSPQEIDRSNFKAIAQTLMQAMIYYQRYQFQECREVRRVIFVFLKNLLSAKWALAAFFENSFLLESYLVFIFESAARPIVLATLLDYLVTDGSKNNEEVMNQIVRSLQTVLVSLEIPGAILLFDDLLRMLETAIRHVPNHSQPFGPIAPDLCCGIVQLSESDDSRQLIFTIFDFMIVLGGQARISSSLISALEVSLLNIFPNPTESLFCRIVQLVAGHSLTPIVPSFSISQPKFLRLLISVFTGSSMFGKTINFVNALCTESTDNCKAAHLGGFDTYLLSLLNGWKNDPSCASESFRGLMSLFTLIAGVVCSVPVVQSFHSLLINEGHVFPIFYREIVQGLASLVASSQKEPLAVFPFISNAIADLQWLKVENFQDGFTVALWIRTSCAKPGYQPRIISLQGKQHRIEFRLHSSSISILYDNPNGLWTTSSDYPASPGKWTFMAFTLSLCPNSGQYELWHVCNGSILRIIYFPEYELTGTDLVCKIGGGSIDSEIKSPSEMSFVVISGPMPWEVIHQIYELGPWPTSFRTFHPFVALIPRQQCGVVNVSNCSDYPITVSTEPIIYYQKQSFRQVMACRCGATFILPLFSYWNLRFEDGETFPDLWSRSVELLESCLRLAQEAQELFYQRSGFQLLAYLLLNCDDSFITYKLYLKFASLLGELSLSSLRSQLFDSILMNVELWFKCSADDHLRVVKHWARILVAAYRQMTVEMRPFAALLNSLTVYYWYEFDRNSASRCQNRCQNQILNVKECRNVILTIAHIVVGAQFTESDFRLLISSILSVGESEQKVDLLKFLCELVSERDLIREKAGNSLRLLMVVQCLLNLNDDEVCLYSLQVIVDSYAANFLNDVNIGAYTDILLHHMGSEAVSSKLFEELLKMTTQAPYLFPICSWMAINLGRPAIKRLLSKLSPGDRYETTEFWSFYLVFSLFHTETPLRQEVARFLLLSSSRSLSSLFATIEILGRAFCQIVDPIKQCLLFEYGSLIRDSGPHPSIKRYLALVFHFLMFRSADSSNSALHEIGLACFDMKTATPSSNRRRLRPRTLRSDWMFNDPPFSDVQERLVAMNISPGHRNAVAELLPHELDGKIRGIASQEFRYIFGLRLMTTGQWIDADLAVQAVTLFIANPDQKYVDHVLTIAAFLVHSRPEFVHHVLGRFPFQGATRGAVGLLEHQLSRAILPRRSRLTDSEVYTESFEFLQRIESLTNCTLMTAPLVLLKHFVKFQSANTDTSLDILAMVTDEFIQFSRGQASRHSDQKAHLRRRDSELWNGYRKTVATGRGPWKAMALQKQHFKRDQILCANLCPMKLKPNLNFSDHADGSRPRESFSVESSDILELSESEVTILNPPKPLPPSRIDFACEIIRITKRIPATFRILPDSIHLLRREPKTAIINPDSVSHIFLRTYCHHPTAIEIFTYEGKSYFIHFFDQKSSSVIKFMSMIPMPKLQFMQSSDFRTTFADTQFTDAWVSRASSNFEYLLQLNFFSGRSFSSASQYPLFPWILTDYQSLKLDLNDSKVFRDLSRPVGALNPNRLSELRQSSAAMSCSKPYLYCSGNVNPLGLYLWMNRMEPFTSLHIAIQGGKFDQPPRLFSSLQRSFNCAMTLLGDSRELIPEFFFCPEFLINRDNFDFGWIDDETKVDDVVLPPWAQTAYDFIYLHRKALESDHVSNNLHKWIDLIWGDKQRGKIADLHDNTYDPHLYDDIWCEDKLKDRRLRSQIEAIQQQVGQIPPQLFDRPHPSRFARRWKSSLLAPTSVCLNTEQVIAAAVFIGTDQTVKISVIDNQGLAAVFHWKDIGKVMNRSLEFESNEAIFRRVVPGLAQIVQGKSLSAFINDSSVIICRENEIFKVSFDSRTVDIVQRHCEDVAALASDEDLLGIANKDGFLMILKNMNHLFTIPSHVSAISCCSINSAFRSLIFGTHDGFLAFCSLSTRSLIRVVDLQERKPKALLFTPGWGFVVVYTTQILRGQRDYSFSLFTINGDLIRSKSITYSLRAWSARKSDDGFDFVVFADSNRDCYYFEAFFLNPRDRFLRTEENVKSIDLLEKPLAAAVVLQNGRVVFAPVTPGPI
jgi:hypothetical protein